MADGPRTFDRSRPPGGYLLVRPSPPSRIHQYLAMSMASFCARQQDTFGALGLARNATNERNGHVEELDEIRELLTAARDVWRTLPEAEDDSEARHIART